MRLTLMRIWVLKGVLVSMAAGQITDETPAHRDDPLAMSAPVPRASDDLDSSCSAAVLF